MTTPSHDDQDASMLDSDEVLAPATPGAEALPIADADEESASD